MSSSGSYLLVSPKRASYFLPDTGVEGSIGSAFRCAPPTPPLGRGCLGTISFRWSRPRIRDRWSQNRSGLTRLAISWRPEGSGCQRVLPA
jgi:hypothetical protein